MINPHLLLPKKSVTLTREKFNQLYEVSVIKRQDPDRLNADEIAECMRICPELDLYKENVLKVVD